MNKAIITGIICFMIGATSTVFAVKTNLIQVPDNFNGVSTLATLNWASQQYEKSLTATKQGATPQSVKDYNECLSNYPYTQANIKAQGEEKVEAGRNSCYKTYQKANGK